MTLIYCYDFSELSYNSINFAIRKEMIVACSTVSIR